MFHLDGDALAAADRGHINTEVMEGLGELSAVALRRQQFGHFNLETEGIKIVPSAHVELAQTPEQTKGHQQQDSESRAVAHPRS